MKIPSFKHLLQGELALRTKTAIFLSLGFVLTFTTLALLGWTWIWIFLVALISTFVGYEYAEINLHELKTTKDKWGYGFSCAITTLLGGALSSSFLWGFLGEFALTIVLIYWVISFASLTKLSWANALHHKKLYRYVGGMLITLGLGLASGFLFPWELLWGLSMVIALDMAGYFIGRKWGKRKIAPNISPKKSYEGFWAGAFLVMILTWFWLNQVDDLSLWFHFISSFVLGLLIALFGLWGDLLQSSFKRRKGVKDSGSILPGHGGVYDRLDAHLAVWPLMALLTLWISR